MVAAIDARRVFAGYQTIAKRTGSGSNPFPNGCLSYPVAAPALIVVGLLMAQTVVRIDWSDLPEAAPAFLTLAAMPATFGISHGLAAGFVSYAGMKLASGRTREAHWLV